tara:strand:+ start:17 stop:493 length:477 start_codon:yes stop_codon:yes gene_type:complete
MTKLSLVFFTPLVLILIFRLITFSPMPIAEGCEANKIWNLNRIENFSGLTDGLDSFESKKLNKFIINFFIPIVLINSQILVDIKCIDQNDAMIYNNLRNWKGQEQNLITGSFSQNIDLFGNSVDITQEIYEDGGELVREVNIPKNNTGKIKFFYREID